MNELEQIVSTHSAAYRNYHGGYFKVLLSTEESGGNFALLEITLPKGAEPPPHLHTREDEGFYLLEGEIDFYMGGQCIHAKPGDTVFAPRMIPHYFKITTASAKCLTWVTPGNFMNYFLEYSTPATGDLELVSPQGPPPLDVVEKMAAKFHKQNYRKN